MNENRGLLDKRRKIAEIAKYIKTNKSDKKILLVEGSNDITFFEKFIPKEEKNNFFILGIQDYRYEKHIGEEDTTFFQNYKKVLKQKDYFFGGYGTVKGKQALILTIKKQWAEKEIFKSKRPDFYGIVDKDYDDEDKEINETGKLENTTFLLPDTLKYFIHSVDIIKERRIVSTDSNDVETMFFMYDSETVKKILKDYFPESTYLEDLSFSIECACKLGFIRKENKKRSLNLSFKAVLPETEPYKYEQYLEGNDINLQSILNEISKNKKNKIDLSQMPKSFKNLEWHYCRGHDLMVIIACYCIMKTALEKGKGLYSCKGKIANKNDLILFIEETITNDIINNTEISKYSKSKIFLFLNEIMSNSI